MLFYVRRNKDAVLPPPGAPVGATAGAIDEDISSAPVSAPSTVALNALRLASQPSDELSVEAEILKSHEFKKIMQKVYDLRSHAIHLEPTEREIKEIRFYYKGKRIKEFGAPRIVDKMDYSRGKSLGWAENELDIALNKEAERYLKSRYYKLTTTFSVTIEAADLTYAATQDSPFGLKPTTYLTMTHGKTFRISHVVRSSRSPVFEWTGGAMQYKPNLPLHITLYMAKDPAGVPNIDDDFVVGNVFLPAGFLPPPRTMAAPETMTASLGLNVGVLQFSVRGPGYARPKKAGCVLYPCGEDGCHPFGERCCALYICGSPPCCVAYSVRKGECKHCCSLGYMRTKTCLYNSFCCCCSWTPSGFLGTGWYAGKPGAAATAAAAVPGTATAV